MISQVLVQLIEFMNLFYTNLDTRFTKFNVYNVLTMADDFMVVSGMPNNVGMIKKSAKFFILESVFFRRQPRDRDCQHGSGSSSWVCGVSDSSQT